MSHFVVFVNNRFAGVDRFVDQFNNSGNTIEFCMLWEATTLGLGRAAFAHHVLWPQHTLVIVPSVLDLFTWGDEINTFLPFFTTVNAAVAAFVETFAEITTSLFSVHVPCRVVFADLVGFDTLTWSDVAGSYHIQELLHAVLPHVNAEIERVNTWNGSSVVPLGWRIHSLCPVVDGVVMVHDYRVLVDGYLPGVRQQRRWARILVGLLEEHMEGVLPH